MEIFSLTMVKSSGYSSPYRSTVRVSSVPGVEYGIAFCEASRPCLIRTEGNSADLIDDAVGCAQAVAAGHTFFLVLRNAFPINVLNQIKQCQEVARIFAATANPLQIITAETEQGKGIIAVILISLVVREPYWFQIEME